ncbi:MAG: glycosyltransferase family 2 protein [Propionibacteriaceae bacterium]|nr:glycosyltransferase family 2 protein [Propionibacteriaceae bacterium]
MTAVLVCRNAGSWLNATLAGLGQSDRRPDVIVAVDNESSDNTAELLDQAYDAGLIDHIVQGKASATFGQAVERAMSVVDVPTQWIWLLHDDAVPDHAALTELVTLAARTPRLAIAVPLLVRPSRRSHAARTLEVGATISGSGRRALSVEPDEVAQGQYESKSVLGGSTCGMLVRWSSLEQIGGFDPCIAGYRDGVDIGWRVQLIDQWVLTCPTAVIVHRQAGRSEIRPGTMASRAGRSEAAWDRLMGLRLVGAHAHGVGKFLLLARVTVVCLVSALVYLLGRVPDHAKDEVEAWSDFVFHSRKPVAKLRKKVMKLARGNKNAYRVRSLRPTLGSVVEEGFQSLARWFHEQFSPNSDAEMTLDDLLGDEFTRRIGDGKKRVPAIVWLLVVVGGVAAMVRHLYASGAVTASGLLGPPASLSQAFDLAMSTPGKSQPWLLVSAALSALSIKPEWLPVVTLVAAFPITMLIAVWFCRHRIHHGTLRWLTCAGYACLPLLMGAGNRGSLWLIGFAMVLPFAAEWVSRLSQPWMGARSLQGLAGLALSAVVMMAIIPVLWLPLAAIALIIAAYAGGSARIARVGVAVIVPLVFWAQAVPEWVRTPARLFLPPEPMLNPAPGTWQLLLARPTEVGVPPLWLSIAVMAVVWIGLIVVLVQRSWRRWAAVAGLASIAVAVAWTHLSYTVDQVSVFTDVSPWLLVGFATIVFTFVSWVDQTLGSLEGRDFGGKQALVGLLSLLLILSFVMGAGWVVVAGMEGIQRGSGSQIPEYLAQNEIDLDTATLVIDAAQGGWTIRSGGQTLWGQGSFRSGLLGSDTATSEVEQIVAKALAGRSDDAVAEQLATFGVSTVVVFNPSHGIVEALDATAGFQSSSASETTAVWNVTLNSALSVATAPTRRSLVTVGSPPTYLNASDQIKPDSPRTLVLATVPDKSLKVYVGDVEATPVESGDWRAAYALGSASGPIRLVHATEYSWIGWVQLAVVVLLMIFVFPPLSEESSDAPRYQLRSAR